MFCRAFSSGVIPLGRIVARRAIDGKGTLYYSQPLRLAGAWVQASDKATVKRCRGTAQAFAAFR